MKSVFRNIILIVLFVVLTALGARIQIPFGQHIPINLQIFFVLLAGAILGPYLGALSQVVYLLLLVLGLPFFRLPLFFNPLFFAHGLAGLKILTSPGGGFLWGLIIVAYLVGKLTAGEKGSDIYRCLLTMFVGILAIRLIGFVQMIFVSGVGLERILPLILEPTLGSDIVKALLAAFTAQKLRSELIA